ncbi:MAG: hypothetical protein JSS61_07745 [Verrucomicrobia bacterium]|nr:hypothetical protein [Verrucomicrobiota bacterium]
MKGYALSLLAALSLTAVQADTYCSAEIAEKDPWPGFPSASMPATEAPYTPAPAPADAPDTKIVPENKDNSSKAEKDWIPNTEAPTPEAEKDWFPKK